MSRVAFLAIAESSSASKIRSFARLPNGWNFGEGCGATKIAMDAALSVNDLLASQVDEIEVFPGVDGGILVCGYNGNETLEVRCNPSGSMDVWHEIADEPGISKGNASLDDVGNLLGDLGWKPKNSFEYSIQTTTVSGEGDSPARYFKNHRKTGAYLLLIPDVQLNSAGACVFTSLDSTKESLEFPVFSGDLTQIFYQTVTNSHANPRPVETPATGISTVFQTVSAEG